MADEFVGLIICELHIVEGSADSPPAADRVQESQQESILLPLNVVKRREGERANSRLLKKVGRFREGDVRNRGRKERRHLLRKRFEDEAQLRSHLNKE